MRTDTADDEIPADKIDLYLRVAALAEKGAPGEREVAAKTLAKLRLRYPGIEFVAEERIEAERKAHRGSTAPPKTRPTGTPKEAFWSAYTRTFESVSKILSDISSMLDDVSDVTEATAAIDEALTAKTTIAKVRGVEQFRIILDIENDVLSDVLSTVDDDQTARAIADHIGRRLAEALAEAFGGGDDEDDDEDDEDEDDDE